MEQNFNAQNPGMVSYKKLSWVLRKTWNTRNIECFHMKSSHSKVFWLEQTFTYPKHFCCKIIIFRGLGVEQDFNAQKL
jgi:hypothetical protein